MAVSNTNTEAMAHLTELFAEFAELDYIKRQTFQALVEKRADQISSLMDMINLLKATRLCTVFFGNCVDSTISLEYYIRSMAYWMHVHSVHSSQNVSRL